MNSEQRTQSYYAAGEEAFHSRDDQSPFQPNSYAAKVWQEGYERARQDNREAAALGVF